MATVLVTGAAGFIGSHLVDQLLEDGCQVIAIDNFDPFYSPEAKRRQIRQHLQHANYRLIEADIRDLATLQSTVPVVDVIVHLAAKAGVRPSIADPVGYYETNARGTQNLLEIARRRGIRQFVFASSSSVYGVNPNVPWREEDAVLQPISPYASTKVSGELLGHVYSHLFGIRFIVLRFFTVYGPRQRPDLAIHKFSRLMMKGDPVPFFGDGSSRRDYTYVGDIIDGICAAIKYSASSYEVVNLGNNRTITLRELVDTLGLVLGVTPHLSCLPEQQGDVPQTWADLTKAGRLLGYKPQTDFRCGLSRFAEWLHHEYSDESGASLGV
jgi:UDP-glucuronate 4-epimerase